MVSFFYEINTNMVAEEARKQSLNNEYNYILQLIDNQINQGRLYLDLNYIISNITKTKLLENHYEINICGGSERQPFYTQIEW